MVLTVTQEAFDGMVRENMEEFGLTFEEATQDTIKQYEMQGADLSRVIVDLMACSLESKDAIDAVARLKESAKTVADAERILPDLVVVRNECDKGLTQRVLAGKQGVYDVVIDLLKKYEGNDEMATECFKTLHSLMTKQPDLLTTDGAKIIVDYLEKKRNEELLIAELKWTKECCVMHENNRQTIFDLGVVDELKKLVPTATPKLLGPILAVLRALTLDDDVRVEFGRAHEHARRIASNVLLDLTVLMQKYGNDDGVMNDLLLTLSTLLVRNELCKVILDAGALPMLHLAMAQFSDNEKIARQSFKVLKAFAGNDECKQKVIKNGIGTEIIALLDKHKTSAATAVGGLSCIATLTLRSPENSKALFECGAPKMIIEIMKLHPDNESIQKTASWAIRNMVSRSRYQKKDFIDLGAEEQLQVAIKKYKKSEYDFKAALRDLECDVDLKEEWTGKGGLLHTEQLTGEK